MEVRGKRQYERTKFRNYEVKIEVESKKNNLRKLEGFFKDISVGGCKFVLNSDELKSGEMITLRFTVPDMGNVVLSGTIKGVENKDGFYIYRAEFLKLTQERIKMIKEYLNFEIK
ncbi:MAG: PilZ domain-containing protein [Bacillota bacterium]